MNNRFEKKKKKFVFLKIDDAGINYIDIFHARIFTELFIFFLCRLNLILIFCEINSHEQILQFYIGNSFMVYKLKYN